MKWYSRPSTFEWQSSLGDAIFKFWMNEKKSGDGEEEMGAGARKTAGNLMDETPDEMPPFLKKVDGEVYAPGLLVPPRKTNTNVRVRFDGSVCERSSYEEEPRVRH